MGVRQKCGLFVARARLPGPSFAHETHGSGRYTLFCLQSTLDGEQLELGPRSTKRGPDNRRKTGVARTCRADFGRAAVAGSVGRGRGQPPCRRQPPRSPNVPRRPAAQPRHGLRPLQRRARTAPPSPGARLCAVHRRAQGTLRPHDRRRAGHSMRSKSRELTYPSITTSSASILNLAFKFASPVIVVM